MNRVVLKEWNSSDPLPIEKNDIPTLRRRLKGLAEVIYDFDGVKLKAKSHIGYIPIAEDLQLVVMPKIDSLEDLFYVLERAGMTPKVWMDYTVFAELDDSERQDAPLFLVRMLLRKLRLLRRDGFYRKALLRSEVRATIKGKIEQTNTVRQCLVRGRPHQVHCAYFDPSVDIVENRFIKYTIWRLIRSGMPKDIRRELQEFWRIFASIPFEPNECYLAEVEGIIRRRKLPSSRAYYLDILSLCFLIIENSTVIIKAGEDVRLSAFAINMDDLFERYIRNVISEVLHPEFSVLDGNKQRRQLFVDEDKPTITPDIMVYDARVCPLVADTKYKEKDLPSADDWYQIISYALALGAPIGMLIYSADTIKPPQEFHIADKTLWVYYYPLQQPKKQEADLVEFVRKRAQEALVTQKNTLERRLDNGEKHAGRPSVQ